MGAARPRIVLDTNLLVPGVVGATAVPPGPSASASLIRAWTAGYCTLVVSDPLLDEYEDVMQRQPFGIAARAAAMFREVIANRAVVVKVRESRSLLTRDPDDDVVLKTALAGKAEMLVTNNVDDFREIAALPGGTAGLCYRGVRVVGLPACLAAIRATHADAERAMRRRRRWP